MLLPVQHGNRRARVGIPEAHGAVVGAGARCDQLAVGRPGHRAHDVGMAGQVAQDLAVGGIPDFDRLVG